jgi:hypothetical protein
MSPAQEVLGKRLCDEAQLQEGADGALAQALGQTGGIMNGQVVELTGGVESACLSPALPAPRSAN